MDFLGRLALYLDRPDFDWKVLVLGFGFSQYLFETFLAIRQHRTLSEGKPPKELKDDVSQETYDRAQEYSRAKSTFGFISGFYSQITNVAIIYFDVLPKLWAVSGAIVAQNAPAGYSGEISQSCLFFVAFNLITSVISLPFSYYKTFVIEEQFGFNKQTPGIFFSDLIKSQVLVTLFGVPILAAFIKIVQSSGTNFFYYLWVFIICVQALMVSVYPIFIQPFFNKLTPLEPGELKDQVEALASRLKFPLGELYIIDGSKRSAHSNAYFYGFPWSKQIVIYDTLIARSEVSEVVAILSHELGHWKEGHTSKMFLIAQFHLFYIFALFSVFINNHSLYTSFGFHTQHPILIGFLLFNDILSPLDTIVKLYGNIMSRKHEFQADAFAAKLGYAKDLAKSLIKLQVENLSTMDADWLYSSYHYTHPILSERLRALEEVERKRVKGAVEAGKKE